MVHEPSVCRVQRRTVEAYLTISTPSPAPQTMDASGFEDQAPCTPQAFSDVTLTAALPTKTVCTPKVRNRMAKNLYTEPTSYVVSVLHTVVVQVVAHGPWRMLFVIAQVLPYLSRFHTATLENCCKFPMLPVSPRSLPKGAWGIRIGPKRRPWATPG